MSSILQPNSSHPWWEFHPNISEAEFSKFRLYGFPHISYDMMTKWSPTIPKTYYYGPIVCFSNITSKLVRSGLLLEADSLMFNKNYKTAAHVLACVMLSNFHVNYGFSDDHVGITVKLIEDFLTTTRNIKCKVNKEYIYRLLKYSDELWENRWLHLALDVIDAAKERYYTPNVYSIEENQPFETSLPPFHINHLTGQLVNGATT